MLRKRNASNAFFARSFAFDLAEDVGKLSLLCSLQVAKSYEWQQRP